MRFASKSSKYCSMEHLPASPWSCTYKPMTLFNETRKATFTLETSLIKKKNVALWVINFKTTKKCKNTSSWMSWIVWIVLKTYSNSSCTAHIVHRRIACTVSGVSLQFDPPDTIARDDDELMIQFSTAILICMKWGPILIEIYLCI